MRRNLVRFRFMIAAAASRVPKAWAKRSWTFQELEAELPETNLPTELWDGELLMSPAPFASHQEVLLRFYRALDDHVVQYRLGKVFTAPLDMVLTTRRAFQPDVLFVARQRLDIIQKRVMGPADLVAEVLSPESRRRDRIDKRDLYEQHGIKEYWILDPEAETVEVFRLKRGEYELYGRWGPGEKARSALLKGFEIEVGPLFLHLSA